MWSNGEGYERVEEREVEETEHSSVCSKSLDCIAAKLGRRQDHVDPGPSGRSTTNKSTARRVLQNGPQCHITSTISRSLSL